MRKVWAAIIICVCVVSIVSSIFIQDTLKKEENEKNVRTKVNKLASSVSTQDANTSLVKNKKYDLVPLSSSEYKKYGIVVLEQDQIPKNQKEYDFYVENLFEQNKFWEKESTKTMLEVIDKNTNPQRAAERHQHVQAMITDLQTKLKNNPPNKEALEIRLQGLYHMQAVRNAFGRKLGRNL